MWKQGTTLTLIWLNLVAVDGFMQVSQSSQGPISCRSCYSKLSGDLFPRSSMLTSSMYEWDNVNRHGPYSQAHRYGHQAMDRNRVHALRMCDRDFFGPNECSVRSEADCSTPYQLKQDSFDLIRNIPRNALPENIPLKNLFGVHLKEQQHPEHSLQVTKSAKKCAPLTLLQHRIKIFASDVEREIAFWTRGLGMTVFTEESSILLSYDDITAYYTSPESRGNGHRDEPSNILELVEGNQVDKTRNPELKQQLYIQIPFRPNLLDDIKKVSAAVVLEKF